MKRSICKESNRTFFDHGPKVSGLFKSGSWISAPLAEGQRYVEMFLVVDNAEYQRYQGNMQTVRTRMLEVVNHVDKLYRPVKIRVMLVGLEIWSNRDKIVVSTDPDETLTRFLEWRKTELLKKKKHDNAHFVTGVNFDGSTVGLANKFAMCTVNSGAVNEDHNRNPIGLASTIAHEMGHNLGMSHDSEDCMCETAKSSKRCIMADSVGGGGLLIPQSIGNIHDLSFLIPREFDPRCLLNIPSPDDLYGGPQCGNDFLEPGEECDCGSPEECRNPCCNATTCRLKEGVQCAQGECCQNCKIRQVGHLCRESAQECDLPEYCTGQSPDCPKDDFKMNGLPCNQGYCYNGKCPTHLKHCQTLWGSDANVAASQCFRQNTEGNEHLYCKQDVKCGKIHCNGGNPFPITQRKYTIRLWGEQCNVADIIEGETEDLGLVPTGTKCGENKVCIDSVCRDIEVYRTKNCSAKCNNHGVCNHERECHCDPGWEPPYCNESRNVPRGGNAMIIGVSVAVMILILLPIIIGGIMCCRGNKKDDYSSEK
ncbi:ADAM8 protein, partial [Amia calva]|nr:ADAM8 protein [Amia calva]